MSEEEFNKKFNELLEAENDEEKAAWLSEKEDEATIHQKKANEIKNQIVKLCDEHPEFT